MLKAMILWRRFRLPAYALLLSFVVIAMIPATRTWYVRVTENQSNGEGVTSAGVNMGAMPYVLYVARPRTDAITQIDHVDVYTNTSQAILNTYDAIFGGDHNKYTSAYVRMPVYGIPSGKDLKLTVTCQADYLDAQVSIARYISNVIQVSCAVIPTSVIPENANSTEIYVGALTYFQNNAASLTPKSFVDYTVTSVNGVKNANVTGKKMEGTEKGISFTIPSSQIQMTNDKAYIYFKIDYNEDLVYHYIRNSLWGKGGFKIGETAADGFAGTITDGNTITYDLQDVTITVLD